MAKGLIVIYLLKLNMTLQGFFPENSNKFMEVAFKNVLLNVIIQVYHMHALIKMEKKKIFKSAHQITSVNDFFVSVTLFISLPLQFKN